MNSHPEFTPKRLKAQMACAALLNLFFGIPAIILGWLNDSQPLTYAGFFAVGISAAWGFITEVRIWWNHG